MNEAVAIETEARQPKLDAQGRAYGTGRRKDATARVWIKRGSGNITVNGKTFDGYFARPVLRMIINQPFTAVNEKDAFDITVTVKGGGLSGQAGAVRHGISRALDNFDPSTYHKALRQGGFLTREFEMNRRYLFFLKWIWQLRC